MQPTTLIFDLDETLLADALSTQAALVGAIEGAHLDPLVDVRSLAGDIVKHAERVWESGPAREYAEAIGISPTEGLWGAFTGDDPGLRQLAAWAPGYHRAVWSAALDEHGITDDALATRLAARFREERLACQLLFPDALPALDGLRVRYRLAMLTNGAPDIQRAKIAGAGLASSFEVIVVSGEVGVGKPDPRIFTHTLDLLNVPASEAVMIGDNLTNDIRGAQGVGMRAIWIDRRDDTLHELSRRTMERVAHRVSPDATITSLAELPAAIQST